MSDFQISLACVGSLLILAALVGATLAIAHDLGADNRRLRDRLARLHDRTETRP